MFVESTGMEQAVQRVKDVGISLSALGADGEELRAAGFYVDVAPAEVCSAVWNLCDSCGRLVAF